MQEDLSINIILKKGHIKDITSFKESLGEERIKTFQQHKACKEIHIVKNYLSSETIIDIVNLFTCCFDNLKVINLTANNLEYIPSCLDQLNNIEVIVFNNNKISAIDNIFNLKKLKRLELRSNKITNMNIKNFDNHMNLKQITLSCNLIDKIFLKNLDYLEIIWEIYLKKI